MGRSDIAIVIPAYNESKTILEVVDNFKDYGDVLVVDDKSTDNTLTLLKSSDSFVLSHRSNLGYEAAISTGIDYALKNNYKYIITTDGDGELPHLGVNDFIKLLEKGAMLVVGIRDKKNRAIEYLFGLLTSLKFNINDPLCGMKGYNSEIFTKYKFFDKKNMIGTELLAYSLRDQLKVQQIHIYANKREDESRYGDSLSSFFKIMRVIFIFFFIALQKKGS